MTKKAKETFDKLQITNRMHLRDTDRDSVPDVYDCKPYDPTRDGFWGDAFRRVTRTVRAVVSRAPIHVSRTRAASRRAAVSRAVTPSVRRITRTARAVVSRAPIHVSRERAGRRREAVREGVVRLTRPAVTTAKATIARTGIDYGRAEQRRATVMAAGLGAPKQALTEIAKMGAPSRARMERGIEATTARQQAKFPEGTLSGLTTGFARQTARVARVARGFEKPVEQRMQATEKFLGLQSERIPAPIRRVGGQAKRVGYGIAFTGTAGAVEMAGMVPQAAETMARRPEIIPAAVGVGLVTMGRGMYHGAVTDPARMAGEFIAFGAITKAPSLSPVKFKPTFIKFPTAKGVSIGMETRRGGVTKFKPGITVMPRAEKLVTIGTPKIIKTALVEKGVFTPKTALEAKIVARSLGREGAKITEAIAVRAETARAKVTIKEVTPTIKEVLKHHGISEKSASTVLKTTKSHKGTLFGSIIQRAAGERGLLRVPRDFDVVVKNPIKFAKDVAAKINKAEGRQVVVAKEGKVTVRATGEKLFDIHAPETAPSSYAGRAEIGYGLLPEKLIKPEGLRMRSFSEQTSRKLEGGMIVGQKRTLKSPLGSVTGRIVPKHEGRIKDILDFYTGEKLAIERLTARGKIKSATKADTHLEKWLDTWGKDLATNIRQISKKQIKTGVPTEFAFDFAEPAPSKLAMYPSYPPASATYSSMPPSVPPSVPPYRLPPSMPPSPPPSVPPSIPPSMPPSVPPSVPPYRLPPSMPPSAPPSLITTTPPPPPPIIILPKPKPKPKHRLPRKKAQFKPEYWQIENPIASIQDMIGGHLQQIRSPKMRKH